MVLFRHLHSKYVNEKLKQKSLFLHKKKNLQHKTNLLTNVDKELTDEEKILNNHNKPVHFDVFVQATDTTSTVLASCLLALARLPMIQVTYIVIPFCMQFMNCQ